MASYSRLKAEWRDHLSKADEMTLLNWKVKLLTEAETRPPDRRRRGKFKADELRLLTLVDHRLQLLKYEADAEAYRTRGLRTYTLERGADPHPEKTFGKALSPMQKALKQHSKEHYWRARRREDEAKRHRWVTQWNKDQERQGRVG